MSPPVEVQYHLVDKLVSQFYLYKFSAELPRLLWLLRFIDCASISWPDRNVPKRLDSTTNPTFKRRVSPTEGFTMEFWMQSLVTHGRESGENHSFPSHKTKSKHEYNTGSQWYPMILWYCRGFCQESTLIESARIETKHDQTLASTCSNVLRRVLQSCKPIRRKRDHCRSQHHFLNVLIQLNSLYIPRWIN